MASCLTIFLQIFTSARGDGSVSCMVLSHIRCLDTADYYHQYGRCNAGCTSTIPHDLKTLLPGRWIRPKTSKTVHNHGCTISNFEK